MCVPGLPAGQRLHVSLPKCEHAGGTPRAGCGHRLRSVPQTHNPLWGGGGRWGSGGTKSWVRPLSVGLVGLVSAQREAGRLQWSSPDMGAAGTLRLDLPPPELTEVCVAPEPPVVCSCSSRRD